MRKRLKILYIVFSVLVIGVVGVLTGVSLFADGALRVAIESAGTKALNVGVSVSDVDLSVLRGRLGVRDLKINNPPGYQHEKLLELSEAGITLDVGTVLDDVINVKDIRLDGVTVILEQRGVSGNNLQDIMKSLPAGQKQTSEAEGKKLHIDSLEITNAKASVKLLPVPGKVDTLTVKLAPIKMTDLGGEKGIDSIALSRTVLLAIAGGIAEQGADILPEEMLGSLASELQRLEALPGLLLDETLKVMGAGKDAAGAGAGIGQEVLKGAEEVGKGITEGLKGLLKPNEKE
ncbi:MAG: AsmA family protein [Phycisphaerales bacterium]|nr:MAG: AsmA family protein [Phycisphaerales bacterium]